MQGKVNQIHNPQANDEFDNNDDADSCNEQKDDGCNEQKKDEINDLERTIEKIQKMVEEKMLEL